jgi:hypothetical protein
VTSPKIKAAAVQPAHLSPAIFDALKVVAPNSIGSAKITDAGVMAVDLAPGVVGSSAIVDGSITASDLAAGLSDGAAAGPTLRSLGTGAQQAAAGNDARLSDTRTPTGTAGGGLSGTYPSPTLAPGSVGSSQVVDGSLRLADTVVRATNISWPPFFSVPAYSCFQTGLTGFANLAGDTLMVIDDAGMPSGLVSQNIREPGSPDAAVRVCNLTGVALVPAGTSAFIQMRP